MYGNIIFLEYRIRKIVHLCAQEKGDESEALDIPPAAVTNEDGSGGQSDPPQCRTDQGPVPTCGKSAAAEEDGWQPSAADLQAISEAQTMRQQRLVSHMARIINAGVPLMLQVPQPKVINMLRDVLPGGSTCGFPSIPSHQPAQYTTLASVYVYFACWVFQPLDLQCAVSIACQCQIRPCRALCCRFSS